MLNSRRLHAICLLAAAPWALRAQDASQTALIQSLLARIDKLEKRVAELETKSGAVTQPEPVTAGTAAASPVVHDMAHEAEGRMTTPNLRVAGFTDINFSATDQPGAKSGFNEGQFILHLSSALSPRVSYFGELSLTARADAGTGVPPANGFNFEVERSIIRF